MFWKVLLAATVAIGLIQLGALYVWVSVLKVNRCAMIPPMECSGSVARAVLAYRRAGVLCFTNCSPSWSGLLQLHGLISPLERVLSVGIALRGGFLIPLYGLRRILGHAFTIFVHRPESILCIGRSLRCVLLQLRQAHFCGWS